MTKSTNTAKVLNLKNDNEVVNAIKEIRKNGNGKDLNILIDIYQNTKNDDIKKSIYSIFCDLKDQKLTKNIIEILKDTEDKTILKMLVASCWESRLDYLDYFELFINLIMQEDFTIAFDAFTLLENFDNKITESRRVELSKYVKDNIVNCKKDNIVLALDLPKIINNYKE